MSGLLADEFCRMGHEVTVVTQTLNGDGDGFRIVRQPSRSELFSLVKWCDVFWHNNLSLRSVWPALLLRKPLVITHQGSYSRLPSGFDLALRLKHALFDRLVYGKLRAALGGDRYEASYAAGRALTRAEAIEFLNPAALG